MHRFPGVFMDANRRSCIAVSEGAEGISILQMAAAGLSHQVVTPEQFEKDWKPSDYSVAEAANRYLAFAQKHEGNDPLAIEILGVAIMRGTVGQGDPVTPQISNETKEFSTQKEPEVSDTLFTEKGQGALATQGADTSAVSAPEVTQDPPVVTESTAQEVLPAAAPVQAAAGPEASAPAASQTLCDDEQEQSYAVHVNGQSVTVQMGKARETRMPAGAYADRPQTIATAPVEPTFYVALDENGVMARCATVNPLDRKVIGALIGGWVAEGFVVTKAGLKEMGRFVSAARKAQAES